MELVPLPVRADDLLVAREWNAGLDPAAVAQDEGCHTAIGGRAVARWLASHEGVEAVWIARDGTWPGVVRVRIGGEGGAMSTLLVSAEPSSMEPDSAWPARLRVRDVEVATPTAWVATYVPKRRTLEMTSSFDGEDAPLAWGVGWLPGGEIGGVRVQQSAPQEGRPFTMHAHETRIDRLRPLASLVAWLCVLEPRAR